MHDDITASIRPGDGDQHYATLTLAAVQATAYRALDSDGNPRQRLVIDIDTNAPTTDELAIYVNDTQILLIPPRPETPG
jgi:hypothetical protein